MPEKYLFFSGLVLLGFFALGHLGGFIQAVYAARHDPNMANLTKAMREHKTSMLGLHPSVLDFREYFSLNFSILLFLASAIGFAMIAISPDQSAVIRTLCPLYVVAMFLLLATSFYFSVVQGIILCPMVAILFGLAWWLA